MLLHLGIGGHGEHSTKFFGGQKPWYNSQWLLTGCYFRCWYSDFFFIKEAQFSFILHIDYIFLVKTRNLVIHVHSQIFFSIFFCWLNSENVVFKYYQAYVIKKYPYVLSIFVNVFDDETSLKNVKIATLELLQLQILCPFPTRVWENFSDILQPTWDN